MSQSAATHAATFHVPTTSGEAAARLVKVLEVEAKATPSGTRVALTAEGATLVVTVEADEARTLRAATNSILRLVAVATDVDAG